MKREIASKLLPWISKTKDEHLSVYVEYRLDNLRKALEIASDINEIYKLQGQIKEVKRLLSLREEINSSKQEE